MPRTLGDPLAPTDPLGAPGAPGAFGAGSPLSLPLPLSPDATGATPPPALHGDAPVEALAELSPRGAAALVSVTRAAPAESEGVATHPTPATSMALGTLPATPAAPPRRNWLARLLRRR
jgi:hypothetical protein